MIECCNAQVELDKVLGITAFSLDRLLEMDPEFLVGGWVVGHGGGGGVDGALLFLLRCAVCCVCVLLCLCWERRVCMCAMVGVRVSVRAHIASTLLVVPCMQRRVAWPILQS